MPGGSFNDMVATGGGDDDPSPSQPRQGGHEEDPHGNHEVLRLIGPAFATKSQFWFGILYSGVIQGAVLGGIALGFFNLFEVISAHTWLTHEYEAALHGADHHGGENVTVPLSNAAGTYGTSSSSSGGGHGEEEGDLSMLQLGGGSWLYVGWLTLGGFTVGLTKVLWSSVVKAQPYPYDNPPNMIEELQHLRSDAPWAALPVLVCSALSLGFGASVGPEAAMGTVGVAIGSGFIARRWGDWVRRYICRCPCAATTVAGHEGENGGDENVVREGYREEDEGEGVESGGDGGAEKGDVVRGTGGGTAGKDVAALNDSWLFPDLSAEERRCGLDGLAAAFGALFPSQYLSPMMLLELGGKWGIGTGDEFLFMETVARTGAAATVSFTFFTGLKGMTFLSTFALPFAAYDVVGEMQTVYFGYSALLGVFCGLVGVVGAVILGIGKKIGGALCRAFDGLGHRYLCMGERGLGQVVTPTVGGALLGLLAVGVPLTLGDGAHQIGAIANMGHELGVATLCVTALVKLVTLSISIGFGFVGGNIFPFVFTGACIGSVTNVLIPDVPLIIAVTTCIVAIPCAFIPAIFTFTTLASLVVALGGAATSPVFVGCICSYTTVCGFGLIQSLINSGGGGDKEREKKGE